MENSVLRNMPNKRGFIRKTRADKIDWTGPANSRDCLLSAYSPPRQRSVYRQTCTLDRLPSLWLTSPWYRLRPQLPLSPSGLPSPCARLTPVDNGAYTVTCLHRPVVRSAFPSHVTAQHLKYATLHRPTIIWSLHRSTFVHLATKSTIFWKFIKIDRLMSCASSKHGTTRTLSAFWRKSPIDHAHNLIYCRSMLWVTLLRSSCRVLGLHPGNPPASSMLFIVLARRPSHLRSSMTYLTLSTA